MGDPQPSAALLRTAYSKALELLRSGRFASAERQLRSLLSAAPADARGATLLGAALIAQDEIPAALGILEPLAAAAPRLWTAHIELARALRAAGRAPEARARLRAVVEADPSLERAWLAYGDVLVDLGNYPDARLAFERARLSDPYRAQIERASDALAREDRRSAELIFRELLKIDASHVGALCGLAAVSLAVSRAGDAERLLRHALKQAAHLPLAWRGLCQTLVDLGRLPEAHASVRHLLQMEAENPGNWVLLGNVCARLMRQPEALHAYAQAARLNPREVRMPLSMGHLYKTLGRRRESEASYKASLAIDPAFGEAYWSLADLKNYAFDDAEIAAMQTLLRDEGGEHNDQAQLHFALGRAFEQRGDHVRAFAHYARGNARRRNTARFDIAHFEDKTLRVRRFFDALFFARHAAAGHADPAPIFIVGLPRSGSTLVEQILASHSAVEGTFELPNVLTIVREFDHANAERNAYPESLGPVAQARYAALGRRYIEETAPIRTGRSRFIDKMPNNFSHVGLIHAMLPRATVVDVRRHPMDACFSSFKQYFAEGQSFSYDLRDLGLYYRCYLSLMDHWDTVLPGKVLHLSYEHLVHDPQTHIRLLLEHCGLDFEPACLSFHETRRPVRTASAEQVRQPLYTSGVGYWRHVERELEPLRVALGDCLERFD